MQIWLAGPLLGGTAQGSRHLIELFAAFGLTTLIGLERTIQGKVAGLRTQTIVGTSAALIELDSDPHDYGRDQVGVTMTLTGSKVINAAQALASVDGVSAVVPAEEEPD
jgi:putative Mg2+ transporter-C (MgtC) family protein